MSTSEVEPDVERVADGVLVHGFDVDDVRDALRLLPHAHVLQATSERAATAEIVQALLPTGLDPTPTTAERRARRIAQLRMRLLVAGAYTYARLAELGVHSSAAVARSWAATHRDELVTAKHDGKAVIPAFQLTEDLGAVRDEVAAVNRQLSGVEGWDAWAWWCSTTALLSGDRPVDVVEADPGRVARAASRFAQRAARGSAA